jgi:hypothetical protein
VEERSTVVGNLNASLLGQEIKVVNRSFSFGLGKKHVSLIFAKIFGFAVFTIFTKGNGRKLTKKRGRGQDDKVR